MKRYSNRYLGLAILAGTGIGIAVGSLAFNEQLRHQMGRKMRRLARACRNQSAELRDTASELLEKGGRNLKGVRGVYHKLAG